MQKEPILNKNQQSLALLEKISGQQKETETADRNSQRSTKNVTAALLLRFLNRKRSYLGRVPAINHPASNPPPPPGAAHEDADFLLWVPPSSPVPPA